MRSPPQTAGLEFVLLDVWGKSQSSSVLTRWFQEYSCLECHKKVRLIYAISQNASTVFQSPFCFCDNQDTSACQKAIFWKHIKKTIFLALNSVRVDNTRGIDDSLYSTLIVVGQLDLKNITIFCNKKGKMRKQKWVLWGKSGMKLDVRTVILSKHIARDFTQTSFSVQTKQSLITGVKD